MLSAFFPFTDGAARCSGGILTHWRCLFALTFACPRLSTKRDLFDPVDILPDGEFACENNTNPLNEEQCCGVADGSPRSLRASGKTKIPAGV